MYMYDYLHIVLNVYYWSNVCFKRNLLNFVAFLNSNVCSQCMSLKIIDLPNVTLYEKTRP